MTKSKGGLGRGLAALIPSGPQTNTVADTFMGASRSATATLDRPGAGRPPADPARPDPTTDDLADAPLTDETGPQYREIPLDLIQPNPRNPRTVFDEDSLAELVHSIREFGLLQPIVVRPAGAGFELVMGERRWRAAQEAGLPSIPAIVRRTEDANLLRDALLENIHRANLNPLEEAAAYQQLLAEFEVTHEELAARLGRSRPVVSNTIRLLKLPVAVQRRVAAGVLSAGHARALLALEDPADQEELATRVVAEGLSVRGTEEAVTLLASRSAPRRRPAATRIHAAVPDVTARLADALDTRVRIQIGRRKGQIIVEFALDDLDRLVDLIDPIGARRRSAAAS